MKQNRQLWPVSDRVGFFIPSFTAVRRRPFLLHPMNRLKFDAWNLIHATAAAIERVAARLKFAAIRRSTKLNLALLNERRVAK